MHKRNTIIVILSFIFLTATVFSATVKDLVRKSDKSVYLFKYKEALEHANKALELEQIENGATTENFAIILGRIGQAYFHSGDMKKAAEYFQKEVDLLKTEFGSSNMNYVIAINDLACVYQYLGDFNKAEDLLNEAVVLKKDIKGEEDISYARSVHNLAKLYQTQGRYERAEEKYNLALSIKEKAVGKDSPSYATTLLSTGLLNKDLGNYKVAKKQIEQSLNIFESELKDDDPRIKVTAMQLALLNVSEGSFSDAGKALSEFEDIDKMFKDKSHPDYAPTLHNLAMLYWSQKNYKEAKKLLEEVLNISNKQFGKASSLYSACINSLGLVCWAGKMYNPAYQYLLEAVSIRKQVYGEDNPKYATSLHNLAGLLSYMGMKDQAEIKYKEAMKLYFNQIENYFPFLSEKEKTNFYAMIKERLDLFNCYALENMEQKPELIGEMYNNQLIGKSILLKNFKTIRNAIIRQGKANLLKKYDKWKEAKEELSKLYSFTKIEIQKMGTNIDELERKANNLEKELSNSCSEFKDEYAKKNINWKDIQKELQGDEAAVEILKFSLFRNGWSDSVFYVALILTNETTEHPEIVILDRNNQLETKYIKFYNNSIKHKISDDRTYKAFWAGIDEMIKGKNKIYFAPDGVYNKLSIASLRLPNGEFLIDSKDIINVSNTSDIIELKKKQIPKRDKKTACLFGFPKEDSENAEKQQLVRSWKGLLKGFNFAELPQTKVEIAQIDKLLKENKYETSVYLEDQANEKQFKSIREPNLLHIATHGFFLTDFELNNRTNIFGMDVDRFIDNPLFRSGLILSDKDDENGILTAFEVKNQDFVNTDLVILSACETGAGELKNGEGVYGLQRAFSIAGADAVIMSLWKVDDLATQELMTEFYNVWLSGMSVRNALKIAKQKIKEKYTHPYYWAGFVLMNN